MIIMSMMKLIICVVLFIIVMQLMYQTHMTHAHFDKWKEAMKDVMQALEENDTFELVALPEGKHIIGSKWFMPSK